MNIPWPSRAILRPSVVSMTAMFGSLAAWLFPSFGVLRKGFNNPARLDFGAFVVLACWYMLIFMSFSIGEKAGRLMVLQKKAPRGNLFDLDSNFVYGAFTLLTTIGIASTVFSIFRSLSLQQALVFIALGQANSLKEALYENYSVGVVSLRYLVLYSASIALYRIIRFKSYSAINIFNIVMLGVSTLLLGSRLIFIATLLTATLILTLGKSMVRISLTKTIALVTSLFLILGVANFARNKDYYERNGLSFVDAGVSEIIAYLGSPFQVAVGSAAVTEQLVAGGNDTYRNYVDEETNLNTNSAFVHLHEQIGYASWVYISGICLFMGFVFEALRSLGRTIFLLPCGAILYGSAELWRLDLFRQGIFIVWFVIGIGLPAFLILYQRLFGFIGGVDTVAKPVS